MATKIRVELNHDGFKELFSSDGVKELLDDVGAKIRDEANAALKSETSRGFESHTWKGAYGGGRLVNSVSAIDRQATYAEQQDKILSKAVHP